MFSQILTHLQKINNCLHDSMQPPELYDTVWGVKFNLSRNRNIILKILFSWIEAMFGIGDTRQDKTVILGETLPIFHSFSAYGNPSAIFPPTYLQNSPISAYFHLFSAYFLPKMVPHPCYKLKHGTHLLSFRPHVYGFCLFSAYIPLIFRLFST